MKLRKVQILFSITELSFPYLLEVCKILKKKNIKPSLCYDKNRLSQINEKLLNDENNLNIPIFFQNNTKNKPRKKIDYKYLAYLEKFILKEKSIWEVVSYDREFGRGYIKDIFGYDSKYIIEKEKILIDIINDAKNIEILLRKVKPNFFCLSTCVGSANGALFYYFCKFLKINFITATTSRFKNYFYLADNLLYRNSKIKKNYLLLNKKKNKDLEVEKFYKEINSTSTISSDALFVKEKIKILNSKILLKYIDLIKFITKHTIFFLLHKFGYKAKTIVTYEEYPFFQPVYQKIKLLNNLIYLKKKKYQISLNTKYIYFPLHRTPEYSTLIVGNKYMDQLYLIETLSKNIPAGYKLLVKEHPSMLESTPRLMSFYQTLMKFPNVELVDIRLSAKKIIKKAQLVIVIDGSSAIEAIIAETPVLTMVPFVYDFLELSIENSKVETLNQDIKKALLIKKKFKREEIKSKIKKLLKSILSTCYNMRNPDIFYYTQKNPKLIDAKKVKEVAEDYSIALMQKLK
jgi:hypothetical protein